MATGLAWAGLASLTAPLFRALLLPCYLARVEPLRPLWPRGSVTARAVPGPPWPIVHDRPSGAADHLFVACKGLGSEQFAVLITTSRDR